MEKVYYCRKMFFQFNRHIYAIFGLSMLFCWLPIILPRIISYSILSIPFDLALSLSFLLFMSGMLVWKLVRELQRTVWVVTDTGIIFKTPYRVAHILFKEATHFGYGFSFLHGRIGTIKAGKKIIRLPFSIQHLHGLITDIANGLVMADKQDVIQGNTISRFKRYARIIDVLLGRLGERLGTGFTLSCLFIAANIIIPQRIWFMPMVPTLLWIFICLLLVILYFFLGVLVFVIQRTRFVAHHKLLTPLQNLSANGLTAGLIFIFYLIAGIAFKGIVFRFY